MTAPMKNTTRPVAAATPIAGRSKRPATSPMAPASFSVPSVGSRERGTCTFAEFASTDDSVSRALLLVLDRLSPAQRVAVVLHDVFAVPFDTIGELLDRSPDAAKKLASRARSRLQGRGSAELRQTKEHLKIVEAFLTASRGGDIRTLLDLLAPDVVRRVNRVPVSGDVPTELRGAKEVAEETRRLAMRAQTGVVVLINGVALAPAGRVVALLQIGIEDGRIHTIDIVGDADRLDSAVFALPQ